MMRKIYITHCSRQKDPALELSGKKVTPAQLYTSPGLQQFIRYCDQHALEWAILSDRYGVVFRDEQIGWYSKPPDTVTENEFADLLDSFVSRLAGYDEIHFQHRPGETHPVFSRIVEQSAALGMNVKIFPVEAMDGDDQPD